MRTSAATVRAADRGTLRPRPGLSRVRPRDPTKPQHRSFGGCRRHRRGLSAAREGGEPAGRIAARELEVVRIESALRGAEELAETSPARRAGADPAAGGLW